MKREDIEPIFKSGHEACRFAYAFNSEQYPVSIMGRMMKTVGIGSGRGLFGLDGAAIAGTVKRNVESLPMPIPIIIAARYEIDDTKGREYCALLVEFIIPALGTGGHNRRMVEELICLYFKRRNRKGELVKLANLAQNYDLSPDTITRRKSAAFRRLLELESNAQSRADDELSQNGLV